MASLLLSATSLTRPAAGNENDRSADAPISRSSRTVNVGCLAVFRSIFCPHPNADSILFANKRDRGQSVQDVEQSGRSRWKRKKKRKAFVKGHFTWQQLSQAANKRPDYPISNTSKTMERHFLFSRLTADERSIVLNHMCHHSFRSREAILSEGERVDHCFFIESGKIDCFQAGTYVESKTIGDTFGDFALLLDEAISDATFLVSDRGEAHCWSLDRVAYRAIVSHLEVRSVEHIVELLDEVFGDLTRPEKEQLAQRLIPITYDPFQVIIAEGETGKERCFYIVEQGRVDITKGRSPNIEHIGSLEQGTYFGEGALLCPSQKRLATITASGDGVVCLALNLDDAIQMPFMPALRKILERNFCCRVMRNRIQHLKAAPDEAIELLATVFEGGWYDDGDLIIRNSNNVAIVIDGMAQISHGDDVKDLNAAGAYAGEDAFRIGSNKSRMSRMLINMAAVGTARAMVAPTAKIQEIMSTVKIQIPQSPQEEAAIAAAPERLNISSSDLDVLSTLGNGSFGKVKLVRHRDSGELYALKQLSKAYIAEKKLQRYAKDERRVMEMLAHPFVVAMYGYYADSQHLCMVLEFIPGTDLHDRLSQVGDKLRWEDARLYICMVIMALEHVHSKRIVYRDLKPENLMIGADGYLKLVDFGMSMVLMGKTFTSCGTTEYMAPEIIMGRGYTRSVDVWALGVMLFEMTTGHTPFNPTGRCTEMVVCKNIVKGQFQVPANARSRCPDVCEDLVRKLLQLNPNDRIGAAGWQDVKDHDFFDGVDWNGILRKEVSAPWIPDPTNPSTPSKSGTATTPPYLGDQSIFADWE